MDFTGERFIPLTSLIDDEIYFEHLHRYYTASRLVKDKIVLDIACGVGYGTAILAKNASKIFGIDIDEESIAHAKENYKDSNISFLQGSVEKIPLPDHSVDVVISYETIEHLEEQIQALFLKEITRVLRKTGVLVISTPDKINYSERYSHKNIFHIKEFTKEEFSAFLGEHFKFITTFLQGNEIVDAITPENPADVTSIEVSNWQRDLKSFSRKYQISICSNEPLESDLHYSSVVFQVNRNFLEIMDAMVDKEKHILELGAWGKSLDKEIAEKNSYIQQLQQKIRDTEKEPGDSSFLKELVLKQATTIENLAYLEREKTELLLRFDSETVYKKELENRFQLLETDFQSIQQTVLKRDETIAVLNKKIESTEGENKDKNNIIAEQKEKIHTLYFQLETLNGKLNEIYVSDGWKWLNRYYNLKGRLLPEHSQRYRLLKKTFNKLRAKKETAAFASPKTSSFASNDLQRPNNKATDEIQAFNIIDFVSFETPTVSIIIPVYDGWAMTYKCLQSIRTNTIGIPYEIIIADDGARDETKNIGDYIKNIVIIRNEKNLGFLNNCNNASAAAKGKYILFLNNDTEVGQGWLSPLLKLMEKDEKIGMTGSKLIYPDGQLQEAGGIIWNDGSGWNFGHRQDPDASQFNYVKEVDYISGAAILIRKDLWNEIGGFDQRYVPAYCEDSDLAFEVRKRGYKVVYQPLSEVIHYEGYSHGKDGEGKESIKSYQRLNNQKFREKWKDVLEKEQFRNGDNVFWARDRSGHKKTILVVDHYVPHFDKDAGSKTVFQYLKLFIHLGFNVKFIGDNFFKHEPYTTALQQMGIEVLYGAWYGQHWQDWIKDNHDKFDYVLLNRPHVTIKYIDFIRANTLAKILYYGHDLHFIRERKQHEVEKDKKLLTSAEEWEKKEKYIFSKSDIVLAPSDDEKKIINEIINADRAQTILPFFFEQIPPPVSDFTKRKDILFVGGFSHRPNVDGILWFVREIFPIILNEIPGIRLNIVGSSMPEQISKLASSNITIKGFLTDEQLDEVYSITRIAVIPLRYGAGVKGKTVESLQKGIPIISTSFGVEGLPGDFSFLNVANTAEEFAAQLCSLYRNEERLAEQSARSVGYMKNNFTEDTAMNILKNIFNMQQ